MVRALGINPLPRTPPPLPSTTVQLCSVIFSRLLTPSLLEKGSSGPGTRHVTWAFEVDLHRKLQSLESVRLPCKLI